MRRMERGFAGLRKLTQISPFTNAFFFLLLKRLTYKNSHETKTNNNNLKTDNAKASKKVKTPPFTPSALAYCRPHKHAQVLRHLSERKKDIYKWTDLRYFS